MIVETGPSRTFTSNSVLVNTRSADVEAAAAEMEKGVTVLGLDAERVRSWIATARTTPAQAGDARVFIGQPQGYLRVDVGVRREELSDEITLDWDFAWDSPGISPTSPSGQPHST